VLRGGGQHVAFSTDGRSVAAGFWGFALRHPARRPPAARAAGPPAGARDPPARHNPRNVRRVVVSPGGRAAWAQGASVTCGTPDGTHRRSPGPCTSWGASRSPDDRWLAGSEGRTVHVWDHGRAAPHVRGPGRCVLPRLHLTRAVCGRDWDREVHLQDLEGGGRRGSGSSISPRRGGGARTANT
jgi:hypothetical protein